MTQIADDADDVLNLDAQPNADHSTLEAWVSGWLLETIRPNTLSDARWCSAWREHPEAVQRLAALWNAWLQAQHDGGDAPARWWISLADPTMDRLTGPKGPFVACTTGSHRPSPTPWSAKT